MANRHNRLVRISIAILIALPTSLIVYKLYWLGYSLADVMPRVRYHVALDMTLDGHDAGVKVRTFLPVSDGHQSLSEEQDSPGELHFSSEQVGLNREAVWSGSSVADATRLRHRFAVVLRGQRYQIDPALPVPAVYPASVAAYLRPEQEIQVDDPEIAAELAAIDAGTGPLRQRLWRIYQRTAAMKQRPFKGTTDALTALRLGEASCNGKSRLFVALARAAGIPARLVGGLILHRGHKRTSHQWVEAYLGGHWIPFDPTNHHFAELPERYLVLYRGDEALFRHTKDINFGYQFETTTEMVPSSRAKESFRVFNVWGLFERMNLPFSLLRTLLMLPIGALIVVLFRNVIGMPTFGTFLPALLAAAAGETGLGWGLTGVLIVMAVVALVRATMDRLRLLHSPMLAILLACVVLTMLTTSLVAEGNGLGHLARLSFFPIAVLAIAAERFYLALVEQGPRGALHDLFGTVVVVASCYVLMNSLALQTLLSGFPEILLYVVAANVYLGRWIGVRVSEYIRFRQLLTAEAT